jgi:hypothetical protein
MFLQYEVFEDATQLCLVMDLREFTEPILSFMRKKNFSICRVSMWDIPGRGFSALVLAYAVIMSGQCWEGL